ncbi:MAG: aminotransferase class I/II-fold pyridoxal phosphate-dependent enzyme [Actinomycetota bacterium]|nr:aminotransferase class I/II-fold pyridoxal phosphate-dependent enzyme [Actinomycetota bacterium]
MTQVNLFSDTQTRPTAAMREAMARAEVGDEQRFEDPTVNALCERVAKLLGFEAAVFLPTGTMCNVIAFRLHLRPGGDAVLLHRESHPVRFEAAQPAVFSGAHSELLDGPGGMFDAATLSGALSRPGDRYGPRSRLVAVEQTTNIPGGRIWPLQQLRDVVAVAQDRELRLHLDGARLLNAVVASGVPAGEWTRGFDTAWIDFTKGLGAPVGACLAGSRTLIDEAWRYKQMLGGAMRQAGIVAAGALYALDCHVDRLAEDHANARLLAQALAEIPSVGLDVGTVETNIVVFSVPDAFGFCETLAEHGVVMNPLGPDRVRVVTHLDVSEDDVRLAAEVAATVLA